MARNGLNSEKAAVYSYIHEKNIEGFDKSSHKGCYLKKAVKIFTKFTRKHLSQSPSFLIKLQDEVCNIIKKETLAKMFSCEFCEI